MMRPTEYNKLEQDDRFKKYYLSKTLWWKNFLFIAPTALMFIGLSGILYMSSLDELFSFYAIPYILVFAVGTIWLKALKKHVQKKAISAEGSFLVCAGHSVGRQDGRMFFLFATDSKRHNQALISKLAPSIDLSSFADEDINQAKKGILNVQNQELSDSVLCIKAIKINTAVKANPLSSADTIIPLLYISDKEVFVVRRKDLL